MRMTKNGVLKMRDRLIAKGFIKKNIKGHVKTTVTYNSVYRLDKKSYNSVTNRYTQYNSNGILSIPKNNIENNKEKELKINRIKDQIRQSLRTGKWDKQKI